MWKKIEPSYSGRPAMTGVSVARYNGDSAFIRISGDLAAATRADVFVDGTRIGILPHDRGEYALSVNNGGSAKQLTIPAAIKHLVPIMKASRLPHVMEGPMIVVDLAGLCEQSAAA